MTVEIKQLVIRATIVDDEPGSQGEKSKAKSRGVASSKPEKASIVAECVEQVMLILEEQKER